MRTAPAGSLPGGVPGAQAEARPAESPALTPVPPPGTLPETRRAASPALTRVAAPNSRVVPALVQADLPAAGTVFDGALNARLPPGAGGAQLPAVALAPSCSRAEFLRAFGRHQLRLKGLSALTCLFCVSVIFAMASFRTADVRETSTGSVEEVMPYYDFQDLLDGGALRFFDARAVATTCLGTVVQVLYFWVVLRSCGKAQAPRAFWAAAATAVLAAGATSTYRQISRDIPANLVFLIIVLGNVLMSWIVGRAVGVRRLPLYSLAQTFVVSLLLIGYQALLTMAFYAASDTGKAVFRLVLVPCLAEVAAIPIRMLGRVLPAPHTDATALLSCGLVFTNAFYGRVLVASLDSIWGSVLLSLAISAQEVLFRATAHHRDAFYMSAFCLRPYEVARAAVDSARGRRVRVDMYVVDEMAETVAIGVGAAVVLAFRITPDRTGAAPAAAPIVASAAFQLLLELTSDVLPALYAYWRAWRPATLAAAEAAAAARRKLPRPTRMRNFVIDSINLCAERAQHHVHVLISVGSITFFALYFIGALTFPGVIYCTDGAEAAGGSWLLKWWPCGGV